MGGFARRVAIVGAVLGAWLLGAPALSPTLWTIILAQAPSCTSNPTVCENQLTGSAQSEWDIQGAGDATLQGFATDISVNAGATVAFKIRTSAPGFVIDIYRLGYYGGAGARKVASLTPTAADILAAQNQPPCLTDAASGLVDCGNWSVSGTWNTSGVTSGVFVAKLSRSDNLTASSHIYFIVRDDARRTDVLFQTSDTTWQAYNQFGGGSLYCGGPFLNAAGAYSCPNRAAKVSYNRPFDTRVLNPRSFLFNAEYPMIRWLEGNGYDVKYWTGIDTDRYGLDAAKGLTSAVRPKIFLSVGHDEYWSADQRAHVERARDAGVNLAFFSGNEMFWKTRFEPSLDGTNTAFRTLVSYKETFGGGARVDPDPAQPWTGTWRDPRFPQAGGGVPENGVTGQLWTVNCCSDRIHVPPSMAGLRFWRNTAVASLTPADAGYRTSVETLGYEWDEDIDNGFRPAGLVRLSSTTLVVPERVIDYGINVAQGTATHSLSLYRHTSGALVFGAGTVQWSWGLDGVHDMSVVPPDPAMQQATVNLFADMGVQPRTLQAGLVAATMSQDIAAPSSTILSPATGTTVDSGSRVTINGTAVEQGGGVVAGVEVSVDNGTTWHRANLLASGSWTYAWTPASPGTATIRSRAFDDSGNAEVVAAGTTVTIGAGTCPCSSLWRPATVPTLPSAADANALEVGTKFFSDIDGFVTGVRFYKSAANTGTHVGNLWSLTGTRLATVTFANETPSGWQQATFAAPVAIRANTTYVISYHTNVGSYSADAAYFATAPIDSPPLHAPTSPVAGGNGVFVYGASQFPNNTFNASNYWVDLVFAASVADSTPPVVSQIKASIVDSSKVTITWTTNEDATSKVQYSTDPSILDGTTILPPGTQTLAVATFVTLHSVTLSGLTPNTTYYYRVVSVDRSGNGADVAAPSVTVPGPTLRDTAAADFAAGAGTRTYVAETDDGELTLAPASGIEFSGTTLPAGWSDVPYAAGGAAFIGNGVALVDGSRLGTCVNVGTVCQEQWALTPGHRLEFVATFTGDAFQHSGFAQSFASASEPWAIFSTLSGGVLTARTNTPIGGIDTFLGTAFLGSPHRYTIDWNDTNVVYSIDGKVVATHTVALAGPLRPVAASDFSVFGGNVMIDWLRLSPYAGTGTFDSRVFDANAVVAWHTMQWLADAPTGTTVALSVRTGGTPDPADGTWSAWQPIAAPGPLTLSSRYIQYRAALSSTNPAITPNLLDVIVSTGHAPVAVADAASVPANRSITFAPSGPGSLVANDSDADAGDVLRVIAVTPPAHGVAVLNADGSVTYAPSLNYTGSDAFGYTVSDGLLTAAATVTMNVGAVNSAPVARADAFVVDEDTVLAVIAPGVLGNDTDVDGNPLTAVLVSPPAHGAVVMSPNGAFTYTPQPNYAGPDLFTYKANDGSLDSNVAAVQITVNQINDPPIAEPDAFATTIGQSLTIAAPGVLANDHDVEVEDTAPLTAVLVGTANAHGAVTLAANGSFTYVPESGFVGTASFTYAAVDHLGAQGAPATVTIDVRMESVSQQLTAAGTVSTGTAVTADHPLQTAVTTPAAAAVTIAHGVLSSTTPAGEFTFLNRQVDVTVLNAAGNEFVAPIATPLTLSFTIDASLIPPGASAATLQIFRNGVLVPDCLAATTTPSTQPDPCVTSRRTNLDASVVLSVLTTHASHWHIGVVSTDPKPVARDDSGYTTAPGTPLVVVGPGVLGNDRGRTLLKAALGAVTGGSVALSDSGGFTFTPAPAFCGIATFTYTAGDTTGLQSLPATASIKINCPPVGVNDSFAVLEDSSNNAFAVLANDTDADDGVSALRVATISAAAHGSAAVTADALSVTYTPAADFFGTDTFTYTVVDGHGGSATATVTVTVNAVNDAPRFTKGADQITPAGAAAQSLPGWATNLTAGPANEASQLLDFLVTTDNPALFAVAPAIAPNGTLTYTPAAAGGGIATVTVRLHDNGGTANGGIDTSAAQVFTIILPFTTATTLTSPTVSPTTYGQAVVLNATVTSAGGGTPTGSVDFLDNGALLGTVALTAGSASLTTTAIGAGTARTITATYRPTPMFLTSSATLTKAVTAAATTSTLTVSPATSQYSDVVTFEATLSPGTLGDTVPARTASFKVGTQIVGTADLVPDPVAGVLRAKYTGALLEPAGGAAPVGQMRPGAKTIGVVFNSVSPNYTVANRNGSMVIRTEDASVAYIGDTALTCTSTSCGAVSVLLKARVADVDTMPGDLTKATVAFVNRTTGLTIATVPVQADGTASFTWVVNLGTAASQTTTIGMSVGNYYFRASTLDDGKVTITRN